MCIADTKTAPSLFRLIGEITSSGVGAKIPRFIGNSKFYNKYLAERPFFAIFVPNSNIKRKQS